MSPMIRSRSLVLALACAAACAQETPHPNRVAWLSIFPEPMPEGVTQFSLEATNQFLRGDRRDSLDGRTHAQLQGEEWELVTDLAAAAGPGRFNVRTRLAYRSSGIASRAIMNWHDLLGVEQGGRDQAPTFDDVYHLERNGVTVFDLHRPRLAVDLQNRLGGVVHTCAKVRVLREGAAGRPSPQPGHLYR